MWKLVSVPSIHNNPGVKLRIESFGKSKASLDQPSYLQNTGRKLLLLSHQSLRSGRATCDVVLHTLRQRRRQFNVTTSRQWRWWLWSRDSKSVSPYHHRQFESSFFYSTSGSWGRKKFVGSGTIALSSPPLEIYVTHHEAHVRAWLQDHLGVEVISIPDGVAGAAAATGTSNNCDSAPSTSTDRSIVVGFDVEWRPNFVSGGGQNKVALIQLATATSALLIQMKFVGVGNDDQPRAAPEEAKRRMIATLAQVLDSDRIVKVGVGVFDDLLKLERDFGLSFRNFVDVGLAAKRYVNWSMLAGNCATAAATTIRTEQADLVRTSVDEDRWLCCVDGKCTSSSPEPQLLLPLHKSGLATLVQRFLGIHMPKPRSVRTSNWEVQVLSDAQVTYAAYDALFGRLVFDHLQALGAFCRRDQRSFVAHVFATESARAREATNTITCADTGDGTESSPHENCIDGHVPVVDACVGGLIRSSFRRMGTLALESGWLLRELGSRVQQEDLAWLQSLEDGTYAAASGASVAAATDVHGNSSGVSKETKNVWRQALLRYLSRIGWTFRFDTTISNGGSGSSGGGACYLKAQAGHRITVAVVIDGRILAEGKGASKAEAVEAACRSALYELITTVQPCLPPPDIINYFAGRKQGVHVAFTSYLDSKIPTL